NLLDTGIGIVIGSSFSAMIQTLVDDLLTPLLGLIVGSRMSNWFFVLRYVSYQLCMRLFLSYLTVAEANADGAVILNFGRAAESTVRFICVATAVFAVWKSEHIWFMLPTKECPECVSKIPVRASRCPFCTSEVATLKGGVVILHH
ncbi:hypothetical protein BC832DRAFT_533458, partial [Gaertneriomyces semiglobifer]